MITKLTIKNIKDYSFVEDVTSKFGIIRIYYNNGRYKKLPYRASVEQLISVIESIKVEINYKEEKEARDILVKKELAKPLMFMGDDDE